MSIEATQEAQELRNDEEILDNEQEDDIEQDKPYIPSGGTFVASFDEDGRMQEFVLCDGDLTEARKQSLIDEGWVEISESDWHSYYCDKDGGDNGTGYVRGEDGKPASAPAYTAKDLAKPIKAEYEAQIAEIKDALLTALVTGDEELQAELKQDYADLMAEYQLALVDLEGDE